MSFVSVFLCVFLLVLEINQNEQKALKEKTMKDKGYSDEMKNQCISLDAEEIVLMDKLSKPALKAPANHLEAVSI